jgi:hypothetical protein
MSVVVFSKRSKHTSDYTDETTIEQNLEDSNAREKLMLLDLPDYRHCGLDPQSLLRGS